MGPRSGGAQPVKTNRDNPVKGVKNKRLMKPRSVLFQPPQVMFNDNSDTNTSTSNRYMVGDIPLSNFNDMDDTEITNDDQNKTNNSDKTKKIKNAPIIIVGKNVSLVQNACNEVIKGRKYEFKLLSIGVRVDVTDKTEFDLLCEYLIENKIPHFMYQTADTRPRKIVLYGLHRMETEKLQEILSYHDLYPSNITTLRLQQNRYAYDNQSVYLLYFKSGTVKLSELRKIKHIENILVKWEPYTPRSRNAVPQCRNCQMFGHNSEKCNMPPRCLVCADSHKTDVCKKRVSRAVLTHKSQNGDSVDSSYVKCANCSENHPASYGGCIARKTYIEIQNKLRRPKQRRSTQPTPFQYNEMDFPEMPQRNTRDIHTHTSNYREILCNTNPPQDNTMQQFMMTMMSTFNKLIDKLSSMIEQLTRSLSTKSPTSP